MKFVFIRKQVLRLAQIEALIQTGRRYQETVRVEHAQLQQCLVVESVKEEMAARETCSTNDEKSGFHRPHRVDGIYKRCCLGVYCFGLSPTDLMRDVRIVVAGFPE
jgi:hypothetical protein